MQELQDEILLVNIDWRQSFNQLHQTLEQVCALLGVEISFQVKQLLGDLVDLISSEIDDSTENMGTQQKKRKLN